MAFKSWLRNLLLIVCLVCLLCGLANGEAAYVMDDVGILSEKVSSGGNLGYSLEMSAENGQPFTLNATRHLQFLINKLKEGGYCLIAARLKALEPLALDLLGVE